MASLAGGALVNALEFSGTNFIFGQLGDHGKAEVKRHYLATEQLSKARDEYARSRQQRLDYINKTQLFVINVMTNRLSLISELRCKDIMK